MSENKKSTKHAFKAPAFQLYAKEFLQDEAVIAMELDAVGAYIILLCHQWTEGSIPADPALLARICRTTTERIEEIWPQLEGKFSRKESHNKKRLVNRKLELIRKEKNNFNASQTQHGLNGASARWRPERNPISPEINDLDGVAQVNPIKSGWGSDSSGSGSGSGSGIEEAETHTHTPDRSSVCVMPKAADLDGPTGQRFNEIWQRWPRKEHLRRASQDWISFVTVANESAVMACAERYLASGDVSRGAVMNLYNWLEQQHRDGWAGEWPPPPMSKEQRKQAESDALWGEVCGTRKG